MAKAVIKKMFKKKKTNGRLRQTKEARLLTGIKQGVGSAASKPFGEARRKAGKSSGDWCSTAWNAFSPDHAPLPRAVGAYTVVRATGILDITEQLTLFGPFESQRSGVLTEGGPFWSNVIAVSNASGGFGNPINAFSNSTAHSLLALNAPGFQHAQLVPSAVSLQLMNPEALQTADGIFMCGRSKNVLNLANDTRSWATLADELVSYTAPRLCAAGKLALRGVHCDLIPYNMSKLADFRGIDGSLTGPAPRVNFTWEDTASYATDLAGFAPAFIYNPNQKAVKVLVCVEYRTRFDPSNPAHATHRHHPPTTDSQWGSMVQTAEKFGHGFKDIVEVVASMGVAAKGVATAAGML